jgi:hypothetical protein
MFCGCDFLFKWSKKPFWWSTPGDGLLSIAEGAQHCSHPDTLKAITVQYVRPGPIRFERSGAPSPESLSVPVTFVDPFLESAIDSKKDSPPSYSAVKEEEPSVKEKETFELAAEVPPSYSVVKEEASAEDREIAEVAAEVSEVAAKVFTTE